MGTILLVEEDDDEVATLVTEMLRELVSSHSCSERAGGPGGFADAFDIDLVFADVMIPGPMNGIDLAREMKRRRADIPVLLTTGYLDRQWNTPKRKA
jgi:CheY-like chemotaxis protein